MACRLEYLRPLLWATALLRPLTMLMLDDDTLLTTFSSLPCNIVRGRLTVVCKRLRTLTSSSAALGHRVDVAFLGGAKNQAITPVLDALARLNADGDIREVTVGDHNWGAGTTRKLLKLFPTLEVVDLGRAKKVARHHGLGDFNQANLPALRGFAWHWANDITSQVLGQIVAGRALLEKLDLSMLETLGTHPESPGCGDELLEELGRSCPALKILRLQGDLRFTDRGVCALLEGCVQLKVLVFCTGCIFQQQWSKITLTAVGVDALHAAGFEASDVVTTTFLHPSSRQHKLAFKRDGDHAILFPPRTS